MNNQSNSISAFVSLISAIVILLGFAVMPWFDLLGFSGTALELLQLGQSGQSGIDAIPLIAVAGVIGLAAGGWGLAGGGRTASLLAAAGGALGLIYYVLLLIGSTSSQGQAMNQMMGSLGIDVTGIGFWIALIGCIGLVAQILMPSQSS
jgi:hypothetical protein